MLQPSTLSYRANDYLVMLVGVRRRFVHREYNFRYGPRKNLHRYLACTTASELLFEETDNVDIEPTTKQSNLYESEHFRLIVILVASNFIS